MPSSYSSSLRIELIATGEQDNTWGGTTNVNLGTLLEQAIAGVISVTHDNNANYTLTTANGASDEARNMVILVAGTLSAQRNVVCPTADKLYIVRNATVGGFSIVFKTSGGSGVTIPNGTTAIVYCDGTNVVEAIASPVPITGGGTGATSASAARSALGLVIGTDVQAFDQQLQDIAGAAVTSNNMLVANGTTWASSAPSAVRSALGLVIGTNVQAYDALLLSIAGLTFGANNYIYGTGSDTAAVGTVSADVRTFMALSDPTSSTGQEGIVQLATGPEALAGSVSTKATTPSSLASDQTKSATGHIVLPGGLILNWGSVSVVSGGTNTVTFSKAYSTVYYAVASKTGGTGDSDDADCWAQSWTTSAVTLRNETATNRTIGFFAIGV